MNLRSEGPVRRGKMGAESCLFLGWENRLPCTWTGIDQQKAIKSGSGIKINSHWGDRISDWDYGI